MRPADLRNVIDQVERFGFPFTTYVMTDNYPVLDPAWEAELRARGHGFGQHVWAGPLPTLDEMRKQLHQEFSAFAERYGHGATPVVCLHGFGTSSFLWRTVAPELAEQRHTVVAIDMLGHGESDRPLDTEFGIMAQAEFVLVSLATYTRLDPHNPAAFSSAIIGDLLKPKSFAGLFGAAPSVALATLSAHTRSPSESSVTLLVHVALRCPSWSLRLRGCSPIASGAVP